MTTDQKTDQPDTLRRRTLSATAAGVGISASSTAVAEMARSLSRPAPGSTLEALRRMSSSVAALAEAASPHRPGLPTLMATGATDAARRLIEATRPPTPPPGIASLMPNMDELTRKFASTAGPAGAAAVASTAASTMTGSTLTDLAKRLAQIQGSSALMTGAPDIRTLTRNMAIPIPDTMKLSGPSIGVAARFRADHLAKAASPGIAESLKTILTPPGVGPLTDPLGHLRGLASVQRSTIETLMRGGAPGAASLLPTTAIPRGLNIPDWLTTQSGATALARLVTPSMGTHTDLASRVSKLISLQMPAYRSSLHEAMKSWAPTEAIATMMRSWWPLAERGLKQAGTALNAAIGAWDALVQDAADAYERVKNLLLNWLGFDFPTKELVASAMLVLLDLDLWLPMRAFAAGGHRDVVATLRRLTLSEHRRAKRLTTDPDLRFGGHRLRSLDEPIGQDYATGTAMTLKDLVADRAAIDPAELDDGAITHPGLARVWSKLTDRERELLLEKAATPHTTWPAAAARCGFSREEAERTRRKIAYLLR